MEIHVTCPSCQMLLSTDSSYAGGHQVMCPSCNHVFAVGALPGPPSAIPIQAPQPTKPQRPMRPVPRQGPRTPAATEINSQGKEHTKAKLLLGGVLISAILGIWGLTKLASNLINNAKLDGYGLREMAKDDAAREKANLAKLKQEQEEEDAAKEKSRAKLRNFLSLTVCEGDDAVASELLKELEAVSNDVSQAFNDSRLPDNVPLYMEQRLLLRISENATLRKWFGPRSPAAFAQAIYQPTRQANQKGDGGVVPSFLATNKYSSAGTGFFISPDGWILTNEHVVKNATEVDIRTVDGTLHIARVIKTNAKDDIAILKLDGQTPAWLSLSKEEAPLASKVFTIGYPQPMIQGVKPKFTDGRISSQSGIRDDIRNYQISVPVQHGNSGGPLVHLQNGRVVGIVSAKLSGGPSQDAPENVNYAIKSTVVRSFLQTVSPVWTSLERQTSPSLEDENSMIEKVKSATLLILTRRE